MSKLGRGAFIVIEGVDKAGKSTQCKQLVKTLNSSNIDAELITFPDRTTPIGNVISKYLSDKSYDLHDNAIHLLFSANRWEHYNKMLKLLNDGVTLIVDRYSYSGIVFSSIKKGVNYEWCKQPENGLLKPDIVFLLTLPENEMRNRPGFGGERYENSNIQKKAADAFMKMSKEYDNWVTVDASPSVEEVHDTLLKQILKKMEEVKDQPLQHQNFNKI